MSGSRFSRVSAGGRIDRTQRIAFTFDGREYYGHPGDTLASALLANGVVHIGRSFKYHRPRGVVTAGVEEPNGLVTVGRGAAREPNLPLTTIDLVPGLVVESQNRWPSLKFDVRALNGLAGSLLSAGFYYKTFMGPWPGAWHLYEPHIRRAAGIGRAGTLPDPDRYEHRHEFCDVLVIGGGPAGIAAAIAAGVSGARTVLVEQDSEIGGSLLAHSTGSAAAAWIERRTADLRAIDTVSIRTRTTAFGIYDGNCVGLLERRDHQLPEPAKGQPRVVLITLRAKAIVYCTGGIERPLVFPENDRPGVMLASAARTYLNRFAVSPGRAVVITNNSTAYAAALDLAATGTRVVVVDQRRQIEPDLAARMSDEGIELVIGDTIEAVFGKAGVRGVTLSSGRQITCDLVAMSGGWSPTVHLTAHCGIKSVYRPTIAAFVPGGYAPGHFGAGLVNGTLGLAAAVEEGLEAGWSAAQRAGCSAVRTSLDAPSTGELPFAIDTVWHDPPDVRRKAFVDFQNDVTLSDIKLAHREGYRSIEHLKRYTTLGMGTDQGKTANINALAIMGRLCGTPLSEAETTTFRPPYTPVTIGALSGRQVGRHFRPIRRTPMHDWHVENGATFTEAGQWLRPWFYDWAGDTYDQASPVEMKLVRTAVGLSDISSLGKIDVQGPDAATFLDRVYVNDFGKLPVGKARYGVMLNDDGVVLDDGTTARLSTTRYFMTTTTVQAADVMSWLEFLLQAVWPDLRVTVTSLTDAFAAMALAGPQSRAALTLAFPGLDFSSSVLPYMGVLEFSFKDIPIRVMRLSFSGELGYEIYVPAGTGVSMWRHLLSTAAFLDVRPYGLEALTSLRIEKGHVAGLELDHRHTLDDLGLAGMASRNKAYVGRTLRDREANRSSARRRLVGIECLETDKVLRSGAILFAADDPIRGHGRGYVTSTTWSRDLGRWVGLGFFEGGMTAEGSEIVCAYPLRGEQVRARIVSPRFIDREGSRLRA